MERRFAIDRFEGESAVVIDDDGVQLEVQRRQLPMGAREGSLLRAPVENGAPVWSKAVLDEAEREIREGESRKRLGRLESQDPGGDITL